MEECDVTIETIKTTVRKAFRIKLFSFLQPGENHKPHRSLCGSHQNDLRAERSKELWVPQPMPSHGAKEKGVAGEDQENKAEHKNTGFQSEIRQAVPTCHFFCGEVQKSHVIIANYMPGRPWEPSEKAPFQSKQKWEFALFCLFFLLLFFFPQHIRLTFPYL